MSSIHDVSEPLSIPVHGPSLIDLSKERDLTFKLLDNDAWRQRAVHEIVLRDSDHVGAMTAYQISLPLSLVRTYDETAKLGDWIRLLLPLTVRPNGLLLNVDLIGVSGQPSSLMLRHDNSRLQAEYLAHVSGGPLDEEPLQGKLWVGVSAYTTVLWREHRARVQPIILRVLSERWHDRLLNVLQRLCPYVLEKIRNSWHEKALVSYLNAEFKSDPPREDDLRVDRRDVVGWLEMTKEARQQLSDELEEPEDGTSSSEHILLAVPFVPIRLVSKEDIGALVDEYCQAVARMDASARKVLAEYGRRWHVFVDTVVPVDRPCSIKLSDQRPWVSAPSPVLEQEIMFGEAASTHVELRVGDPGVIIRKPRISDALGKRTDLELVHERRETADAVTFYASKLAPAYDATPGAVSGRPRRERVKVSVRASIRLGHRLLHIWLLLLIISAGLAIWLLPETDQIVGSLTLLIFPVTLAGAVVLSREATSLAERLLRRWRVGLVLAISVIWVMALVRLLVFLNGQEPESTLPSIADLVTQVV